MASTLTPVRITTPALDAIIFNCSPELSSIWRPIRDGAISSTVTSMPAFLSSHAASSPRTPPPMTTAFSVLFIRASTLLTSESRLIAATSGNPLPSIGGIKHSLPSAYISFVKRSFVPSSSRVIVTVARSMALPASSVTRPVTVLPVWAFAVYANSAIIKAKKCFIV